MFLKVETQMAMLGIFPCALWTLARGQELTGTIYDIKAVMIEDGDITCTLVSTVKYSYQLKAGGC